MTRLLAASVVVVMSCAKERGTPFGQREAVELTRRDWSPEQDSEGFERLRRVGALALFETYSMDRGTGHVSGHARLVSAGVTEECWNSDGAKLCGELPFDLSPLRIQEHFDLMSVVAGNDCRIEVSHCIRIKSGTVAVEVIGALPRQGNLGVISERQRVVGDEATCSKFVEPRPDDESAFPSDTIYRAHEPRALSQEALRQAWERLRRELRAGAISAAGIREIISTF